MAKSSLKMGDKPFRLIYMYCLLTDIDLERQYLVTAYRRTPQCSLAPDVLSHPIYYCQVFYTPLAAR